MFDKSVVGKRRKPVKHTSQALNLQAKKMKQNQSTSQQNCATLSQADTRESEQDREAFLSLLKLFIRCHESENWEVFAGVPTQSSGPQSSNHDYPLQKP